MQKQKITGFIGCEIEGVDLAHNAAKLRFVRHL